MQLQSKAKETTSDSGLSKLTNWKAVAEKWFAATSWLAILSGFFLLLLMLFVATDVAARHLLNQPLPGNVELSQTLLVIVVGLAFAYTQATDGNLRLDVIRNRVGSTNQAVIDIASLLLGLILVSYTTWLSGQLTLEAWRTNEVMQGIWGVPYFPSRLALTIGMFLLGVQLFIDLVRHAFRTLKLTG